MLTVSRRNRRTRITTKIPICPKDCGEVCKFIKMNPMEDSKHMPQPLDKYKKGRDSKPKKGNGAWLTFEDKAMLFQTLRRNSSISA